MNVDSVSNELTCMQNICSTPIVNGKTSILNDM